MKKITLLIISLTVGIGILLMVKSQFIPSLVQTPILRIGVLSGPQAVIMEKVKGLAQTQGLKVQIVEFNDFDTPNKALSKGEIDLNCHQHQPFLTEQIKSKGYLLKAIAKTVLMPLGLYSSKFQTLNAFPKDAVIALPNDPTNQSRALLLLRQVGLIKLKTLSNPLVRDIVDNSKELVFKELEAPTLTAVLKDVAAAVVNTDWAILANLNPKTALASEMPDSPYANLIVIRTDQEETELIKKFIKIYLSDDIKDFIFQTFEGAVIPSW